MEEGPLPTLRKEGNTLTTVQTDLDIIQALDFDADEQVPCKGCDRPAYWRATANCCGAFQSFLCPEHRRVAEDWLRAVLDSGAKVTCSCCSTLWAGATFYPLRGKL